MKKLLMILLAVMMVFSLTACSSSDAGNSQNGKTAKMVDGEFHDLKYVYPETLENSDVGGFEDGGPDRWSFYYDNGYDNIFAINWNNEGVYADEGKMIWTIKNDKFLLGKTLDGSYENNYYLYTYEYGVASEEYQLGFEGFSEEEAEMMLSKMEINGEKISLEDRAFLRNPDKILSDDELLEHLLKIGFMKIDGQVLETKAPFSYGEIRPFFDSVDCYSFSNGEEVDPERYVVMFGMDKDAETMFAYTNHSEETVHFGQSDELENDQLIVEFFENGAGSYSGFGFKVGDYAFYDAPIGWIVEEFGEGYYLIDFGSSQRYSWYVIKDGLYVVLDVTVTNGYAETISWSYVEN